MEDLKQEDIVQDTGTDGMEQASETEKGSETASGTENTSPQGAAEGTAKEMAEGTAGEMSEGTAKETAEGTTGETAQEAAEGAAPGSEGEPGAGENAAGAEDAGQGENKKGFFNKIKKKDKKDEKIEELTDQVKRQMAEFDNFRKRTEKEKSQMYEIGAKSIIEKVLPVVDNFERGLAAIPEENKEDAFVDGMNKVYKQMMAMLEEAGVQPIEAVGKEFDPNLHNAVMQTESEEYGSGIVAQELQKGYMYRDSVVRHSMVAVVD